MEENDNGDTKNMILDETNDMEPDKAAVDVPNILVNDSSMITATKQELVESGPKVQAPLAQVEAFEEKMQRSSAAPASSALSSEPRENGQVIRDRAGVLETSIDESLPYEPNRTREDSDEEDESNRPGLDEQIEALEKELISPEFQKDLNLSPQSVQPAAAPAAKKSGGGRSCIGVCVKSVMVSAVVMLLLSVIIFYIVFFSPIKHPFIDQMRKHLEFLEPVSDYVGQKANQVVGYFKK